MLFGAAAATHLMKHYPGVSTHRRTVRIRKLQIDLHVRVRDDLVKSPSFGGPGYLGSLGQELGSMPTEAYDAVARVVLDWIRANNGGAGVNTHVVLCTFPDDSGLYAELVDTHFYRALRYMLCKYIFCASVFMANF